jgi:hypothetical protein
MSEPTNPMTYESYRKARANAKLIKETEWMRVYEMGPTHLSYESKFLKDEVQMSGDSFLARWPSMTKQERLEFVLAYGAKGDFTSDDERNINLIMRDGDDHIWSSLALFMLRHPQQRRVLAFFRERLQTELENPFNYMQALGLARDLAAVPILRRYFDELRTAVETEERTEGWPNPAWRFLNCCEALWKITDLEEYAREIRKYLEHPDSRVRRQAENALGSEGQ